MTLSASIVPEPGSSHSDALSRRNCQAGRSSSGVSSTGRVGSPSTKPAVSPMPARTRSTIDGRWIVGSNAVEILSLAAARSYAVATGCAGGFASFVPRAARSAESGGALRASPRTRSRSRLGRVPPLSTRREQRQDRRRGVRGQAVGGALEPRVEEGDRVGIEPAPVERGREPLRGRADGACHGRPPRERVVERRAAWSPARTGRCGRRSARSVPAAAARRPRAPGWRRLLRCAGAPVARQRRRGCARGRGRGAPSPRRRARSPSARRGALAQARRAAARGRPSRGAATATSRSSSPSASRRRRSATSW